MSPAIQRFVSRAVVLIVVANAALALGCSRPDDPPPPPPPSPAKVDQDIVDLALHDCFVGDCERAHAHLSEVSPTSPLRHGDAFRAIQYRYDADRLLHADIEADLSKRRAAYEAVSTSMVSDSLLRLAASERIARMGAAASAGGREMVLNAKADAGDPAAVAAAEAAELQKKSKSKDPADWSDVRSKLEPLIYTGKATHDDLAMLRTVCKAQKDTTCLERLDHFILR